MLKTNGECLVGSEDVLRALEAAVLKGTDEAIKQAKGGSDVLLQYYRENNAFDKTQVHSAERIEAVVMEEFLHCLLEEHVTSRILDALCMFCEFNPLKGSWLLAYYKMSKDI